MAIRWPDAVGERLTLSWEGAGTVAEVLGAAASAYFELTGVHAVADAEAVGPLLYRDRSSGSSGVVDGALIPGATVTVELIALGRRCAWMRLSGTLGEHHQIWCWRGPNGLSAPIPEAAKIGVRALDGARLDAPQSA